MENPHFILFLSTKKCSMFAADHDWKSWKATQLYQLLFNIKPNYNTTKVQVGTFFSESLSRKNGGTWYACNAGFFCRGDSDSGLCNPPHARTGRGYHKYIEFVSNGASSGMHVLALRKWTNRKGHRAQEGRGFPFPCFCLSSVHCTVAGTSQKSRQMPFSHVMWSFTQWSWGRDPCIPK